MNYWTDRDRLDSPNYRKSIMPGLYAMRCSDRPRLFRVGVCGIRSSKNNANERLKQINRGELRHLGTWSYAFLAPIPDELIAKAGAYEIYYQICMFKRFSYIGSSHINASKIADVQDEATRCLREIPDNHGFLNRVIPNFSTLATSQIVQDWTTAWET